MTVNFQSKNNTLVTLCVVNLECKSGIIRKTYSQIRFHLLRIKKCPKTEPKSKNPIKFANVHRSDACINVGSIKFNLVLLSQDRVLS